MGESVNASLNTLGVGLVLVAAALQEFYMYRKEVMSQRRTCNDSRATLLLYLSLGLSMEVLGLGVAPLPFYAVASRSYADFAHLPLQLYFAVKLEGRLPAAWEWLALCCYFLSLLYFLLSLVVAFPSVSEESQPTEGWLLLNPLVLSYSALAAVLFLCCRQTPSLRLYSPVVPACLGALLACALKWVGDLTVQTLDGANVSPGSFLEGVLLAATATAGRLWLRDRVGQGDRVSATQLLSLCFYFSFLLLLLLPLEASKEYLYFNSASFNFVVLSQSLLAMVLGTQATILQVLGRRHLLKAQAEVKKPPFRRFGETELERESL